LITAGLAGDAGVPVLAVPGAVTSPSSFGTNRLLVDGCTPCLGASDVFDVLGLHTMPGAVAQPLEFGAPAGLDAEASMVWEAVPWDGADASALVDATTLGFGAVSMALIRLQERRLVVSHNGLFHRVR
jgi:DNA processing protein